MKKVLWILALVVYYIVIGLIDMLTLWCFTRAADEVFGDGDSIILCLIDKIKES